MDATELRIHNYTTALDQSQRYLALALGSAVAVWLLRGPGNTSDKLTVAPFGVPVDVATARSLFFAIHIVTAALANYALETAKRVVVPLAVLAELGDALREYPSIPSSPWPGVRLAVPLISLTLLLWTMLQMASGEGGRTPVWPIILSLSVHLPLIMLLWMPPIGAGSLYRPERLTK
jgi:hypothetical protein